MGVNALLQIVIGLLSTVLGLLPPGTPAASVIQTALQLIQSVVGNLPIGG